MPLRDGARSFVGVLIPSKQTLSRYGLVISDWQQMVVEQVGLCAVCGKAPRNGRFNIDHDHVRGWKKMEPSERRKHVRGLICPFCNHYCVGRYMTVERSKRILAYLELHEEKKGVI